MARLHLTDDPGSQEGVDLSTRAMLDALPVIAFVTDADGATLYANAHYQAYTGLSAKALMGGGWAPLIHPEDRERTVASWSEALRSGEPVEVEYRLMGTDGAHRWFKGRAAPQRDKDGTIRLWLGTLSDVHDLKTAEAKARESGEALRGSEERLRLAAQAARIGTWDHDLVTGVGHWDEAALRIGGLSLAEATYGGGTWLKLVHPEDQERVSAAFEASLKPGGPRYEVEFRCAAPAADGGPRWVISHGAVLRDATSSAPIRAIGIIQDITAQRASQEALAESEGRFRNMADHAPVMMWVTDTKATATYFNRLWYDFTGQTEQEAQGLGWLDVVHPDDRDEVVQGFEGATAHHAPFRVEYRLRRADGVYRWVIDAAAPRLGSGGEVLGYVGSVIDITERKEVEAVLRERIAQALEEREQAEEALRQSQKMEAMGQLTGGVAHDFNNLLTPIVAVLDRLQRQGLGGEREQRLIAGAAQSADRAKTLVQRLLAFARRQPLQTIAVDTGELVRSMADLVTSTIGPQIRVVLDAPDNLPPAKADPNQLEMALLNLAVNARDAMQDGGTLRITVTAETVGRSNRAGLAPGPYLRLSVADTGVGMDEATLARAVEPFFSTKGVGKGTGLGLSMVHGLASQLGGALTIQSRPRLGTNVELWLPQSGTAADKTVAEDIQKSAHSPAGAVLLVDDDDAVRLSTADMLTELGYSVVEASSAEEAGELLNEGIRIDLLVTDHLMPGMTGTDLARWVRARRPNLPVLIISGYAETGDIESDLPRLTKPFRRDELGARLARLARAAGKVSNRNS